ncbi:site-specific tyrosine recombinase XerD [Kineococcus rhizosphaerae]|uniref:Tyrosine recombinase XerD n=1 Tax=Kineococcus rhizosphaerae TaxID=559628 RepID=A0A2T0R9F5_9ACTN|nr:site-specific tyrosine recombinase XerD [Kineococcus rhizosphaerae]PRY17784.1 integrase/recombinase XerD [Kineococcus rhizosphaerae]
MSVQQLATPPDVPRGVPAGEDPPALATAVRDYLGHLEVERGLSANTLGAYRRDLARYVRFLAGRGLTDPSDVDEPVVAAFVVALRSGEDGGTPLTASSAARTASAVRGWHRFLHAEGRSTDDPAVLVRPPTPPRRLPTALSIDEVTRLLEVAGLGGDGELAAVPLRDAALLELLYGCGARISEAVGLDLDDVSPDVLGETGVIRLRGKGAKERIVPVGRLAQAALDQYVVRSRPQLVGGGRGTPALFVNTRGGRLSRQSAWAVLQSAARRAGITRAVSPHTLRHSFATHLLRGGADVRVVQELLGHASVATTQVYTLVTAEHLREAHAQSHPRATSTDDPLTVPHDPSTPPPVRAD